MNHIKRHQKLALLFICGIWPLLSQASPSSFSTFKDFGELKSLNAENIGYTNNAFSQTEDPETYARGLKVFHDDIVSGQDIKDVKLTPRQIHQAKVWGLTQDDEKRYVLLMQNRSGFYWKNSGLSPVEILGHNARNTSERNRYAMLYARQYQERAAKELAWQHAVRLANLQVNKGLPLIRPFDVSSFSPYNYHAVDLKPGDQLLFLTSLNLDVRRVVSTLLDDIQSKHNISLNIYFSGAPSRQGIQDWAKNQSIPASLVKKGEITLNTDEGPFARFKDKKYLPALVLVRGGKASVVDMSRF